MNFLQISPVIFLAVIIALLLGLVIGYISAAIKISDNERQKTNKSLKRQRSVLGGRFSEQLAPYLPNFPKDLKPSEAKFLGDPVDFIVFKGLDDKNITEVVFLEVKTGSAGLNRNEKMLKNAINEKRVRYVSYYVPGDVTKLNDSEGDLSLNS